MIPTPTGHGTFWPRRNSTADHIVVPDATGADARGGQPTRDEEMTTADVHPLRSVPTTDHSPLCYGYSVL